MIKELQRTAVMRDPTMAAATLVGAQGEAMKSAAKNEGGAMLGFMGLNMASAAGGMNPQQLYQMGPVPRLRSLLPPPPGLVPAARKTPENSAQNAANPGPTAGFAAVAQ